MLNPSLEAFDDGLYPAVSEHEREIERHFSGRAIRPLSDAERSLLGRIDLFLVVFTNRSGSTLLTELLNQAGLGVPPRAEVFNGDSVVPVAQEYQIPSFTDYFLQVVEGWEKGEKVGFKLGPRQLFWLTRAGLIGPFRSLTILNSQRSDKVAQAVSLYIARQSGQWHSDMDIQKSRRDIAYSSVEIARAMQTISIDQHLINYYCYLHGLELNIVRYEQLVENPAVELSRVSSCLGESAARFSVVDRQKVGVQKQYNQLNEEFARRFRSEFAFVTPPGY